MGAPTSPAAKRGDDDAWAKLGTLPELAKLSPEARTESLQRRHCLAVVAGQLGFAGWSHLRAVLSGASCDDAGTLLSPPGAAAHWNIWSADYEEARQIHGEHGGYLLAYKRHFFITDRHYVEMLGLDPDDPRWARMGRDWARPRDPRARAELLSALIQARLAL